MVHSIAFDDEHVHDDTSLAFLQMTMVEREKLSTRQSRQPKTFRALKDRLITRLDTILNM